MRISDWSSDVCSSDLEQRPGQWWVLHGSHLMLARDLTNAQCQMVAALRNATRRGHRIGIVLQRDREVGGVRDDDIRRRDRRHHAPPRRRPEDRRDGKEGASPCRSRRSASHYKKKKEADLQNKQQ